MEAPLKIVLLVLSLFLSCESLALDLYSERSMALFREIQCPTCRAQTVDASVSSDAEKIRSEVLDLIKHGKTDTEIKKEIADKYGPYTVSGQTNPIMKVWAYSIVGLILIIYFISRLRRKRK